MNSLSACGYCCHWHTQLVLADYLTGHSEKNTGIIKRSSKKLPVNSNSGVISSLNSIEALFHINGTPSNYIISYWVPGPFIPHHVWVFQKA